MLESLCANFCSFAVCEILSAGSFCQSASLLNIKEDTIDMLRPTHELDNSQLDLQKLVQWLVVVRWLVLMAASEV